MDLEQQVGETRIGVRYVPATVARGGINRGRMWLLLDGVPVPMDTTTAAALGGYFNLACAAVEWGVNTGIEVPVKQAVGGRCNE